MSSHTELWSNDVCYQVAQCQRCLCVTVSCQQRWLWWRSVCTGGCTQDRTTLTGEILVVCWQCSSTWYMSCLLFENNKHAIAKVRENANRHDGKNATVTNWWHWWQLL